MINERKEEVRISDDRLLGTVRDVSDLKEHAYEIERLNCLYATLSQVNQTIVRVSSREELFQEVTRVLVEFGKFTMAWIGLVNPATQEVEVAAQQGDETGYLQRIEIFADDGPTGRGPVGTAIREGRPYICNDFINDPCTLPWREAAAKSGWRSLAAFPIRQGGLVCGVLTIYDVEVNFFGEREVALLEEAATDTSFSLDNLEREALRERAEEELCKSEEKFRNLFNNAEIGIFRSRLDGYEVLDVNQKFLEIIGRTREEVLGRPSVILWADQREREKMIQRLLSDGRVSGFEYEMLNPLSGIRNCLTSLVLYRDQGILEGSILDITERRQAEDALHDSELALLEAQQIARVGSYMYDIADKSWTSSAVMDEIFGIDKDFHRTVESWINIVHPDHRTEMLTHLHEIIDQHQPFDREYRIVRKNDDEVRWVHGNGRLEYDVNDAPLRMVGTIQDITDQKKYEEQLIYQANYDILTNLPNRNLLNDRFSQVVAAQERNHTSSALMLMDLDNFKYVNDTLGHPAGDLLLIEVAKRIQAVVRKCDTVARLGGDEFVVVPGSAANSKDAAKVAEQILATFTEPFLIEGRDIFLTASVGIVVFPDDGDSINQLLQHADVAMYHAKHLGKNNFQFFSEDINRKIHKRLAIENRLRRALERKEFLLYYQPLIELKTNRVVGMETLLRWQPAGEEMLLPDKFIPLLEETGLILPVGEWVLQNACNQLKEWHQAGHDIRLSVNLSARQFHSANIVERISKIVRQSGCLPNQICLELTESAIMEDSEGNIKKLRLLREMDFSLSIDDFGTGFSSLNYLKRLPISEIKIDRSFINGLPSNKDDAAIVHSIIHMAKHFGMSVVAEGVQTGEQLLFLSGNACHKGQGYYFSGPLPPNEVTF